jgi:Phage integrase family
VAYETQLKSDRSELHQRVAAAIESRDPAAAEENAALIAEHLEAAGDGHAADGNLVALALALKVSPVTLLMAGMPGADDPVEMVAVTGVDTKVAAGQLWSWLRADHLSGGGSLVGLSPLAFMLNAQPQWEHMRWMKDTPDGNDLARQCEGKDRDNLVWSEPDGGHLRRPHPTSGWFAKAVADSGVPRTTPHDLRHTAASLAVSAGANVKAVQRMLGHASAAMTLDIYADLFDDDLEAVATALHDARARLSG